MSVDRRNKIVETAVRSFTYFGYKATTMDQVARLANVGKGTIYLYFKNKEELFAEIITLLIQEMRVLADRSINPDQNLQQNLHHALFNIIEFRKNHQLINKLLQKEREIGTKVVKEELERMEGSIIFYFKEKIAAALNSFRKLDAELIAFMLVTLYKALKFDWEKQHPPLKEEDFSKIFNTLFESKLSSADDPFINQKNDYMSRMVK